MHAQKRCFNETSNSIIKQLSPNNVNNEVK